MHLHATIRDRLGMLVLLAAVAGCATTRLESANTFPEVVRLYRLSDDKKALAVATNERGKRAWGVFLGSPRQEMANQRALEECQGNAARAGIDAPCYLFAVGDAPAPETLRACRDGRIGDQRCRLQAKYGW